MIVKTEAVVLHGMKYRETSKIVRLFTREFGRVSVIAKGARGPKGKFGSALEPLSYVMAVMYKNDNRDLQLLSQCDILKHLRHLLDDAERMPTALGIIELADAVTREEERNEPLFRLLLEVLETADRATKNVRNALYYFELRLLDILGFKPEFSRCSRCSRDMTGGLESEPALGLRMGGVLCANCTRHSVSYGTVSTSALGVLQGLERSSNAEEAITIDSYQSVRDEVGRVLWQHLLRHVEGLTILNSDRLFPPTV